MRMSGAGQATDKALRCLGNGPAFRPRKVLKAAGHTTQRPGRGIAGWLLTACPAGEITCADVTSTAQLLSACIRPKQLLLPSVDYKEIS